MTFKQLTQHGWSYVNERNDAVHRVTSAGATVIVGKYKQPVNGKHYYVKLPGSGIQVKGTLFLAMAVDVADDLARTLFMGGWDD